MIKKQEFEEFVDEISKLSRIFFTWLHTYNSFIPQLENYNHKNPEKPAEIKYWETTCHSLQAAWMLGAARLLDDAYAKGDKRKEKPRLSIAYVLEQLNDQNLSDNYQKFKDEHLQFIESNRIIRNNSQGHRSPGFGIGVQNGGIEKFIKFLEDLVNEIKANYPDISNEISYSNIKIEEYCKRGAENIWKK